jgi:hypothetical protein
MNEDLAAVVQAYARAKSSDSFDKAEAERLGALLDPKLRDRIDALGSDCERLVKIPEADVMRRFEALELEAHREDASVRARAGRVRSTEEAIIGGATNLAAGREHNPARQRSWAGKQQRRSPR